MTLGAIAAYTFVAGVCAGLSIGQALPGLPFVSRWQRWTFMTRECLLAMFWPIRWLLSILRALEEEGRDG